MSSSQGSPARAGIDPRPLRRRGRDRGFPRACGDRPNFDGALDAWPEIPPARARIDR